MKFLIIRFSSIGDIVLTTPVIRCLKKQVPNAEIHFLTKHAYYPVVEANPYLTKIHVLKDSWEEMMDELKAQQFNYIIDLHKNIRTLRIKRALSGTDAFSFDKLNWEKWLLTRFKINKLPPVHIVDRYMATVKKFDVVNDEMGLDYFIPDKERSQQHPVPESHSAGYIGVVIGASYSTKKLPVEQLQQLCHRIDYPIILMGGPEDQKDGEKIAAVNISKIYNACGKYTLHGSAVLVQNATMIITHDTGLMHIAAAFKKTVFSIWGNTTPAFGMYPYYGKDTILHDIFEVSGLKCRPCSKLGYQKCPKGHFKCMCNIDIDSIVQQVQKMIR